MESAGDNKQAKWRSAATGFAAATAVGLSLGAIGPFGSYLNGTPPVRMAYWVACLWAGWLAFGFSLPRLSAWAAQRRAPLWLWAPPAVALLAVPPAVISRMLAVRLWPIVGGVHWLEWYAQCLLISALITAGVLWATRPRDPAQGRNPASADPRDRLPPRLGRAVLCLKMEDHYVRVHTTQGSALVLMSLSQAMDGLKDLEGVQTHRSWWVARSAITGVVEDGRNLRLSLKGGLQAPVSRARVGRLREEGWLAAGG
ncbi:LytTR family DNA-binding domain-containing protein [Phenylobacterium sp.]|uniref:LytTR family DNA-binding domain-containing protein n=1 Tax=Phenylobacterium sp. TaxID=1871053 RepID=UPI002896BB7D|nr:LytTR family DNA-binding domain-containing protein [Phenylobacterium sp.]